jgi:hypothetical protein
VPSFLALPAGNLQLPFLTLSIRNGGEYEGLNSMPQPETDIQLFSGDTGMVGRTFAVRSYGVRYLLPALCSLLPTQQHLQCTNSC